MKENWVNLRNSLFPKEFGFIFCMIRSSRITKVFITHSSFIPMTRPPSLNYISSLPIFILTFNCSNGQFTFVVTFTFNSHFHFPAKANAHMYRIRRLCRRRFSSWFGLCQSWRCCAQPAIKKVFKKSDSVQKRFKSKSYQS